MTFRRIHEVNSFRDISEVFEEYKKKEATTPSEQYSVDYVSEYIQGRFGDQKIAIEKTVNELAKRTGLMEYIKKVNAELNPNYTSLLDIPKIKEAVDSVLTSETDRSYIDICNKLQDLISVDDSIPEGLKSVYNDKKLVEYIKQHAESKENSYNEIDYLSGIKTKEQDNPDADQRGQNYFHFTPDEHENK